MLLSETRWIIRRKGEADPALGERISDAPPRDELDDVVGGSGFRQLFDVPEILLRLGLAEAPPQPHWLASEVGGLSRRPDQRAEGAVPQVSLVGFPPLTPNRLDPVSVAPPHVDVASPLRMQRPHPRENAQQRYAAG